MEKQKRATPYRSRVCVCAYLLLGLAVATGAGASSALGAFTRPFVRQIAGIPVGMGEEPFGGYGVAIHSPGGIAVTPGGDLWIGNGASFGFPPHELVELDPEGHLLRAIKLEPGQVEPISLAINDSTGELYVAGRVAGAEFRVETYESDGKPVANSFPTFDMEISVAVDNATDASQGDVYVARTGFRGRAIPGWIKKFNSIGEPAVFAEIKSPEIAGGEFSGITVGAAGEVYAIDVNPNDLYPPSESEDTVEGFSSGGTHRHTIDRSQWGGGKPEALAVDPVSGHLLVAAAGESSGVAEFDSADSFVGEITAVPRPAALPTSCGAPRGTAISEPTAVAVSTTGAVYVGDLSCEHAVDVYGVGHYLPNVELAEAGERRPTTAVLNGSVNPLALSNPEKAGITDCHFEYVTEAAYDESVGKGEAGFSSAAKAACEHPAAGEIPVDEDAHAVHAEINPLAPGTVYRYRLLATTGGALGGLAETGFSAFTTPAAPRIDATYASNLSSQYVDLHAQLDALGANTSYHFEYDTREYKQGETPHGVSVPVPDATIGSGGADGSGESSVVQQIGPLAPGTTYHFRLLATGTITEAGKAVFGPVTTSGSDTTFTTLPAPVLGLPDERAYELVTPLDKGDADDMFATAAGTEPEPRMFINGDTGFASQSGDQFLIDTDAAFGPFPGSERSAYVFSRTPAGWGYASLASPSLGVQNLKIGAFDPVDLSRVAVDDGAGSEGSQAGFRLTDLVGAPGGPYATLHADAPVKFGTEQHEDTEIVGGSQDLDHVVLESRNRTLCSGAAELDEGAEVLCEWEPVGVGGCASVSSSFDASAEGCLQLVDANSAGKLLNHCGAILGQSHITGNTHDAVSADGAQVIFTAPDPYAPGGPGCWNGSTLDAPQVYMRSGTSTIELSEPEAGAPEAGGHHPAAFVGASEDASRVFFMTQAELTGDDAGIHDRELYEWRSDGTAGAGGVCAKSKGCRTRISSGDSGVSAGNVVTVPAVSADGSAVYFTAAGQLTPHVPVIGGEQLYVYRYETATGATTYVATVNAADYPANSAVGWGLGEIALVPVANWYTTPDGRYLLFATETELTGYSTAEANPNDCPKVSNGSLNGHCDEVYRYDSQTGDLACLSCDPSGAAPSSNALFERSGAEFDPSASPTRPMSDDGAYAFFDTADALVPQDTNGTLDVYEWHEGRVSLISSGADSAPSFFLGASSDGANVFVGTHANLIASLDTESQGNIFDARICTEAEPCIKPSAGETAQCEGGSCQTPPPAPLDATPASSTFSGAGDLAEQPFVPVKTEAQIRAEKLAKALKACRKDKGKKKRALCQKRARRLYGPVKAHKAGVTRKPGDTRSTKR